MSYAAPTFRAITTNTFSGLVNDANHNALTGAQGSYIQTRDATATPVNSPATVNTTQTLVVPANAVNCMVTPVTNPVQVSEDSTMTAYFAVPAGAVFTFDCTRLANIYLKTSGSTVVSFCFTLI